ncbi:hypothetical protein JMUB7535_26770 [Staphylococcus aureus]
MSRGLGDVYKRQIYNCLSCHDTAPLYYEPKGVSFEYTLPFENFYSQ